MVAVYPAVFQQNDNDGFTVTFPDLPGCVTEGVDLAQALYMARDALALWLDTMESLGEKVPKPSAPSAIKVSGDVTVTLVDGDPSFYARRRQNKAVKRTVSLPEWMDRQATAQRISLSKVLQDALSARFTSIH